MIYTIGHTESYRKYVREQSPAKPEKLGRTAEYEGGSVWRTIEEAVANCPEGYSVWGVIADFDKDTEPNRDGNPWNDLLRDAELVDLAIPGGFLGNRVRPLINVVNPEFQGGGDIIFTDPDEFIFQRLMKTYLPGISAEPNQ